MQCTTHRLVTSCGFESINGPLFDFRVRGEWSVSRYCQAGVDSVGCLIWGGSDVKVSVSLWLRCTFDAE